MFSPGHRIRFAVTNAMWPMLWPTPHPMTTTLRVAAAPVIPVAGGAAKSNGVTCLVLPTIPPEAVAASGSASAATIAATSALPAFWEPEPPVSPGLPGTWGALDGGNTSGYGEIDSIEHDAASGESYGVATNTTAQQYPWGTERFEEAIEHRTFNAEPAKTSVTGE